MVFRLRSYIVSVCVRMNKLLKAVLQISDDGYTGPERQNSENRGQLIKHCPTRDKRLMIFV